jgi:hypothetical protein
MDIIARWRDAINDPPMSDWTGYVRTRDGIKMLAGIVNGVIYLFSPHTSRAFAAEPGDQWLDVTDVPAVPLSKVRAALDEMKDQPSCHIDGVGAMEIVAHHTHIRPTKEAEHE